MDLGGISYEKLKKVLRTIYENFKEYFKENYDEHLRKISEIIYLINLNIQYSLYYIIYIYDKLTKN